MAILTVIEDPLDPRIVPFHLRERQLNTRADRRERVDTGLFVAEGDLVVERALRAGCQPVSAFVDVLNPPSITNAFGPQVPVFAASEDVRRVGMGLGVPLSIVALFRRPTTSDVQAVLATQRIIAMEGVDNPVNIGAIVRSAAALGWTGMLLDRTSADPLARRALRVSMGTTFSIPFARSQDLVATVSQARDRGTMVVALTPSGATPLESLIPHDSQQVMLLGGSERTGLSPELLQVATVRADIPMATGVDSLNAAAAAAVACYALRLPRAVIAGAGSGR